MPESKPTTPVYFTSLYLENVRCFGENQKLDLTCEKGRPARWTIILGDNGVGKTTLLECLAWMRLVPKGYDPDLLAKENDFLESLLKIGPASELKLGAQLSSGVKLSPVDEISKGEQPTDHHFGTSVRLVFDTSRRLSDDPESKISATETTLDGDLPDSLVVAYGANRQRGLKNLEKKELDEPIGSRLSSLTELYDVEDMLSKLDHASATYGDSSREHTHLERLRTVLARILPENPEPSALQIFPQDVLELGQPSGVCLKTFSGLVPLSALSLGYQTTLAWTADLAWRLLERYPESPSPLEEPAVVLIDEIDLHLHPLWQLRIIDDLSAIFPGTQFVATSHSPLLVQVAESANFALLRKREADVEIVNDPEVIRSWRVDQILTSELFAVPIERNRQTELLFARRDELVDKPSPLTAEEAAELQGLRLRISELPTAQDPEDQKAMDLVRRAAALLKRHKVVEP